MSIASRLAVLLVLAGSVGGRADESALAAALNGAFDAGTDGWTVAPAAQASGTDYGWAPDVGRAAAGALQIRARTDGGSGPRYWSTWVAAPAASEGMRVSAWVRGASVTESAAVCVQAWSSGPAKQVAFASSASTTRLQGDFAWTRVEAVVPPTVGVTRYAVLALLSGKGEAWFDDIAVEPVREAARQTTTSGTPGLLVAEGRFEVLADADTPEPHVQLPLPLATDSQIPLTFWLRTTPADAVLAARVVTGSSPNAVADIRLRALRRTERVELEWKSLVLVGRTDFSGVPDRAPLPAEWPADVLPWLRPTAAIQSTDPRIAELARSIATTRDAREIVRRVLDASDRAFRSVPDPADGSPSDRLTAVDALTRKGSCTSRANLVAALLRAAGVPARLVAAYPVWAGPHQTHFHVEAYVPGWGWYPIESTFLRAPWPSYEHVAVALVPPQAEDRSDARTSALAGVPYLSVTEIPSTCRFHGLLDPKRNYDHQTRVRRPLDGNSTDWAEAFRRGRAAWNAWLRAAAEDSRAALTTPLQPEDVDAADLAILARTLPLPASAGALPR